MDDELKKLVEKDLGLTARALDTLSVIAPERSYIRKIAEDFLNMATSYYEDAKHFRDEGELLRALAAVNYAHAWLDAGARLGLFDVEGNDQLFTLAE
ncbi:MAG: DUF357 domain-containing protein [Thermoplasmata archaeon]|nr:MAG: DUF357 domain-containing protein [Thermoplasmata archaeon]